MLREAVPLFKGMASVILVLGIAAILMRGKEVIVHIALAILLSFALVPIVNFLQRYGLGRGLAVVIAIVLALGAIGSIGYVSYRQASLLAADIPNYEPIIRTKVTKLSSQLTARSVFTDAADSLSRGFIDLQKIGTTPASPLEPKLTDVRVVEEPHGLEALYVYLEPLLNPLATLFVVLLLSAFLLGQREDLRNRIVRLAGTEDIQKTTAAIDDAARRVGKMLLTQLAVNTCFGLAIGTGLMVIGLPSPFLWGIFAGILRFVPYIGAVIGLVPPLFVAFAIDPTWSSFLWTIGLFLLIEPLVGHVIEPLLYGHSSGLSPVAIIVAATVWAFLWGPIGLVLSTPLTICLVVIGRHIEKMKFLDILLGDRPALEPHEIFYQRMLANDPGEATRQARDFIKGRDLATYYDDIALEATRRAHLDIVRGNITGQRLESLVAATQTLVHSLDNVKPRTKLRGVSAETEAALLSLKSRATFKILSPEQLTGTWATEVPVKILFGDHPLDGPAAMMLSQVLTQHGLRSEVCPLKDSSRLTEAQRQNTALVFLSFVEPLSTLHLRAYSRHVTRHVTPQTKTMLAIWQQADDELITSLRRKLRIANVTTTISDSVAAALRLASGNTTAS